MHTYTVKEGRINLIFEALEIGEDLCVIIYGGQKPHIGAVTLSIPRPSLSDANKTSASTSVLTLVGHKEDEIARQFSKTLASNLNKNVVVTCGIHVDEITPKEIETVNRLMKNAADVLCHEIKKEA